MGNQIEIISAADCTPYMTGSFVNALGLDADFLGMTTERVAFFLGRFAKDMGSDHDDETLQMWRGQQVRLFIAASFLATPAPGMSFTVFDFIRRDGNAIINQMATVPSLLDYVWEIVRVFALDIVGRGRDQEAILDDEAARRLAQ